MFHWEQESSGNKCRRNLAWNQIKWIEVIWIVLASMAWFWMGQNMIWNWRKINAWSEKNVWTAQLKQKKFWIEWSNQSEMIGFLMKSLWKWIQIWAWKRIQPRKIWNDSCKIVGFKNRSWKRSNLEPSEAKPEPPEPMGFQKNWKKRVKNWSGKKWIWLRTKKSRDRQEISCPNRFWNGKKPLKIWVTSSREKNGKNHGQNGKSTKIPCEEEKKLVQKKTIWKIFQMSQTSGLRKDLSDELKWKMQQKKQKNFLDAYQGIQDLDRTRYRPKKSNRTFWSNQSVKNGLPKIEKQSFFFKGSQTITTYKNQNKNFVVVR